MSCRLRSPQPSYFYPVPFSASVCCIPQVPRLLYPMWTGYSAKSASKHLVHHSSSESIPVRFTSGFTMFMANPKPLVPQLQCPGCRVDQTACGVQGLVAAESSSVYVPFLGSLAMSVKRRCNSLRRTLLMGRTCMRRYYLVRSSGEGTRNGCHGWWNYFTVVPRGYWWLLVGFRTVSFPSWSLPLSIAMLILSLTWRNKRPAGHSIGATAEEHRCVAVQERLCFPLQGSVVDTMCSLVLRFDGVVRKARAAFPTNLGAPHFNRVSTWRQAASPAPSV